MTPVEEAQLTIMGGCYCGALRFEAEGPIRMRGLCLCATCQKISGGAGNLFVGLLADGFRYVRGTPQHFQRPDAPDAPTRDFCGRCGVHVAARSAKAAGGVIVKVGALDDPALFEGPEIVVWTEEKQNFHHVPESAAAFARAPGR